MLQHFPYVKNNSKIATNNSNNSSSAKSTLKTTVKLVQVCTINMKISYWCCSRTFFLTKNILFNFPVKNIREGKNHSSPARNHGKCQPTSALLLSIGFDLRTSKHPWPTNCLCAQYPFTGEGVEALRVPPRRSADRSAPASHSRGMVIEELLNNPC